MLKSLGDPALRPLQDSDEDCEQFIRLLQKTFKLRRGYPAIVPQQFEPELRLVRLLQCSFCLGAELCLGSRS